jgi:hypothetical protein
MSYDIANKEVKWGSYLTINNSFQSFINGTQLTIDQIICFIRRIKGVIIQFINKCVHVVNIQTNAAGGEIREAEQLFGFC